MCFGASATPALRASKRIAKSPGLQVLLEGALAKGEQSGEHFATYAACGVESGAGMSVMAFEWLMVALLCVALPVILWRKWALPRQLLPL